MVWIVEPTSQTVRVYRSETPIRVLGINDTLTGEDVVEGFSCQIAQLFKIKFAYDKSITEGQKMGQQSVREFTQEMPPAEHTTMTLEEFLESDLEGYEYVKGEIIPMPPTSGEHGKISINLILPLGLYVRENQLGDVYVPDTGFQIGDRVLMPDIAFVSSARLPDDLSTAFAISARPRC